MSDSRPADLEARLSRLEAAVEELRLAVRRVEAASAPAAAAAKPGERPPPAVVRGGSAPVARAEVWAHRSEQWLGRVGLGLLFLGLVYLFNYSIEQGWITPTVRVAIGLLIGGVLLAFGLRLQSTRRSYSQILLAGALAVFYVTGFAASQLYLLVSYGAAFAYMAGVMALGLGLARRQDHPSLASLGALGGFATPLLLHRESAAVMELAVYGALVVVWTGALYWLRGWPSLLWTYAVGGVAALSVAAGHATGAERWVVQGSLLLTWALGAGLPFARGILRADRRGQRFWGIVPVSLQLRVLGVGITSAVLYLTGAMWELRRAESGGLFLLAALLFAALAWGGTRTPNRIARAAGPVAATLFATGTFLVLDDAALRTAVLSVEALLFVYAGSRRRLAGVEWVGHGLFGVLTLYLLADGLARQQVAFDALAFAHLLQIVLMLGATRLRSAPRTGLLPAPPQTPWIYRVAAHALFLLWLATEIGPLSSGSGWVTLAWGLYGAVLLLVALRFRDSAAMLGLQLIAFSTLALAVGKLALVDLGRVHMLWRILLFMGFGAGFLGLSSLFKPRDAPARRF
ncbi:MAG TPA: DUF2339 domain-containing protein [Longimicrobiaceae bacterium]|nr:DUF2339 domain-containing protein [Longimicrobiaceae bacterium]